MVESGESKDIVLKVVKSGEKWSIVAKSGEKWGENGEKLEEVVKSGENW